MQIHTFLTASAMGQAAADDAAASILRLAAEHETLPILFATGASQLETLRALTLRQDLPWSRVIGFHLDEYLGLSPAHPASFRRYLRENLVTHVPLKQFFEIDGNAADPQAFCADYASRLKAHPPLLCLLGIGENGHLAFNDPAEADFEDPLDAKVVTIDQQCREQQVAEGWFSSVAEVPTRAITLTIPALMRIPELILSVPGIRKAHIVRRTAFDPISPGCPATILRRHPAARIYLDSASAGLL